MSRIFISHSSHDRDLVEREIIAPLTRRGVDTWYSKENIETADDWEKSIRQALDDCEWFLVALTPHAIESKWVKFEVTRAFKRKPERRIIPTLLETCDPDDLHIGLGSIQHVDFRHNPEQAIEQVVKLVNPGRVLIHEQARPPLRLIVAHRRMTLMVAVALMLLAALSLYWFISRAPQAQPPANAAEARYTPSLQTPASNNNDTNQNSSANANRPGGTRFPFTPLPERMKSSNVGGNK
jgi:hypothetical protein